VGLDEARRQRDLGWREDGGSGSWRLVQHGLERIRSGANQAWEGIKSGVSSYMVFQRDSLQLIGSIAGNTWNTIANGHGSLWDRCKLAAGQAVEQISAKYPALGTAMQAVGATINTVWQSIRGAASTTWSAISGWATNAWTAITLAVNTAVQSIITGLSHLASAALEAGQQMMQALADGIKSAAAAPFNALKNALGGLGQLLPHSDAELGPLSTLSVSGYSLLDTLSRGIAQAAQLPEQAMQRAFAFGAHLPSVLPPMLAPRSFGRDTDASDHPDHRATGDANHDDAVGDRAGA